MSKFKASHHVEVSPDTIFSNRDKDPKAVKIQNELQNHRNTVMSGCAELQRFRTYEKGETAFITEAEDIIASLPESSLVLSMLKSDVSFKKRNLRQRADSLTYTTSEMERQYKNWQQKAAGLVEYIRQKTYTTFSVRELLHRAATHPHVMSRPKSKYPKIYHAHGAPNLRYLVCTISGVKMTPRTNAYKFICGGKIPAPIPLGKIKAVINLTTNKIFLETVGSDREHYRHTGWGRNPTVHPHVLSRYEPCLGDFGPPLNEALDSYDFASAVDIICLFLESADPGDPAGATWVNWVRPYNYGTYDIRGSDRDSPYTRDGNRFEQDENGYFRAISKNSDVEAQRERGAKILVAKRSDMVNMINDLAVPPLDLNLTTITIPQIATFEEAAAVDIARIQADARQAETVHGEEGV
jgi:hypothetical protein